MARSYQAVLPTDPVRTRETCAAKPGGDKFDKEVMFNIKALFLHHISPRPYLLSILMRGRNFRVIRMPVLAATDLHRLSVLDHLEEKLPDVVRRHSSADRDLLWG